MPPFLRGRKCLTLQEAKKSKIIARARIHIERFNQRFKEFKFVSNIVSQKDLPILNQAVFVACFLTNFIKPLAK